MTWSLTHTSSNPRSSAARAASAISDGPAARPYWGRWMPNRMVAAVCRRSGDDGRPLVGAEEGADHPVAERLVDHGLAHQVGEQQRTDEQSARLVDVDVGVDAPLLDAAPQHDVDRLLLAGLDPLLEIGDAVLLGAQREQCRGDSGPVRVVHPRTELGGQPVQAP